MTWLVFAVSGLLVLAGAVSVVSGAPIVQLERGWAEVISGSVAISGGGITFALGVVLLRLQALHHAMVRPATLASAAVEAPAAEPVDEPAPALQDLVPVLPPAEAVSAEPEILAEVKPETRHGLWKRVRRPAVAEAAQEEVLGETAHDPVEASAGSPSLLITPETVEPSEAAAPRIEHPRIDGAADRPAPALLDEPMLRGSIAPEPVAPSIERREADEKAINNRWMKPPGSRSLFPRRPDAVPLPPSTEPPGVEPPAGPDRPEPLVDDLPEPPPVAAPEPAEPVASGGEAPMESVTVVGRYQAGVASYVMYSDGTIHVETEGGDVHRFDSMEDLKAFIARQETAVS